VRKISVNICVDIANVTGSVVHITLMIINTITLKMDSKSIMESLPYVTSGFGHFD
jgi:hypothetical protein